MLLTIRSAKRTLGSLLCWQRARVGGLSQNLENAHRKDEAAAIEQAAPTTPLKASATLKQETEKRVPVETETLKRRPESGDLSESHSLHTASTLQSPPRLGDERGLLGTV